MYRGMDVRSLYITVRDGTRLAADLYLPKGLPPSAKIPTILTQTRYWRSMELRAPFRWVLRSEGDQMPLTQAGKRFFVERGYAMLFVDVRGTGASFGACRYAWEPVTVLDAYDLLDWITAQTWSNGRVGGMGVSYLGTTAELLLATRHPALRAVVPQFNHPDSFVDVAMPGGLLNRRFIYAWTELNESLDQNRFPAIYPGITRILGRGVSPVGGAKGIAELREAVRNRTENACLADLDVEADFRDDRHPVRGFSMNDQVVMRFRDVIMEARVPVLGWASWMDAGTGNAALRRFLTLPGLQMAVVGAWNHGGANQSSPYQPGAKLNPPPEVQYQFILRFFDGLLKEDSGHTLESCVHYFTLGAEQWQSSPTWPPSGVQSERWYLGPEGALLPQKPDVDGEDHYMVDFRASTGAFNRWWELGVLQRRPVVYGDRAVQKPFVLGYESAPLEENIEISGTPVIHLYVTSSEPDCAFYVYLEDVFPDGRIVYLTEGQLRAIHRKVRPAEESPYVLQAPHYSFCKEDALPLVPGEPAEIAFGLLPVSARIKKGHRIRVSISGHDEGTFPRIPAQGSPEWVVHRKDGMLSSIELPIKRSSSN